MSHSLAVGLTIHTPTGLWTPRFITNLHAPMPRGYLVWYSLKFLQQFTIGSDSPISEILHSVDSCSSVSTVIYSRQYSSGELKYSTPTFPQLPGVHRFQTDFDR